MTRRWRITIIELDVISSEVGRHSGEWMARSEKAQPDGEELGLVLLHGAMLGGWIWARVEPLLAGPALAVDFPGRGSRPADVTKLTLGDVVDSVVADIESWRVERVVLVAHSLSGILIPALISRLPGRAVRAVFVSAAVPEPGTSYLDVLPRSERLFLHIVLLIQRKGLLTPGWAARRALCNDLDEATTRLVLQGLTREAPRLYGAPVPGDIPASMPTLYVKLSADHGFSPALQDQMIARLHAPRLEEMDAGHVPMLGHPDRLAAILNSMITPTEGAG
jgi:pimeloyl-ACP methyl ester carboxylesterase